MATTKMDADVLKEILTDILAAIVKGPTPTEESWKAMQAKALELLLIIEVREKL